MHNSHGVGMMSSRNTGTDPARPIAERWRLVWKGNALGSFWTGLVGDRCFSDVINLGHSKFGWYNNFTIFDNPGKSLE